MGSVSQWTSCSPDTGIILQCLATGEKSGIRLTSYVKLLKRICGIYRL